MVVIGVQFSRPTLRAVVASLLVLALTNLTVGAQPFPQQSPNIPPYPGSAGVQARGENDGQTDTAQAAGTASLNFPRAKADSVAQQCDQLADPPLDPLRTGPGVSFEQIPVDQALSACQQAVARQPSNPRYQYLYGRTLEAAGRYAEAVPLYTAADRAGYALASFSLAKLLEDGLGATQNWSEAVRLYFRAGNAGIADAFADGGLIFAIERPPDYREAKSWFEHAVQGESASGYASLGYLYQNGFGVPEDLSKAMSLFTEAVKRGDSEGMYRVGVSYYDGLGVIKDKATACQWFIRAANLHHSYAQQQAGLCYYDGIGVKPNHETAYNYLVPAGQAGLVDARVMVADMLDTGDGPAKNPQAAVEWYKAAAEQGNVEAMTEVGVHLRLGQGVTWSEAQAMEWFAKAAQKGYVPAETALGLGYLNGLGQDAGQGRQDYRQAAFWFGKASQQGDGYADLNLGVMNEKGWGMPQDFNRAKQYYARAAASPNSAVAKLGREYFSSVPSSPERTPERRTLSSSKDSSAFWEAAIIGVLAVATISAFSSGTSDGSKDSGGTTDSGSTSPTSASTGIAPWALPPMPHTRPQIYDPRNPSKAVNGDLTDPNLATR